MGSDIPGKFSSKSQKSAKENAFFSMKVKVSLVFTWAGGKGWINKQVTCERG